MGNRLGRCSGCSTRSLTGFNRKGLAAVICSAGGRGSVDGLTLSMAIGLLRALPIVCFLSFCRRFTPFYTYRLLVVCLPGPSAYDVMIEIASKIYELSLRLFIGHSHILMGRQIAIQHPRTLGLRPFAHCFDVGFDFLRREFKTR